MPLKNDVRPSLYRQLLETKARGEKALAILLDPDKIDLAGVDYWCERIAASPATHLLIGGSIVHSDHMDDLVLALKLRTGLPIVLFPGHPSQLSHHADAMLYLSLLSGRNAEFLIGHHVDSAQSVIQSQIETIPTGYILCGEDHTTAVARVSQTSPIPFREPDTIVNTALAAQLLGKQLVYLEAGSGAQEAVPTGIIAKVSQQLSIPLIVGGGIRTQAGIQAAYEAGADLVVIGTAFENDPDFFDHE